MKSFENFNIAVCFVGQARTYRHCSRSINNFFSSNTGHRYKFFGHAWDTNTYKTMVDNKIVMVEEREDNINRLNDDLHKHFNFEDLVVEQEIYRPYSWASVFYSTMRSNFLKQKYEAENNMMFDLVIKARYDTCYPPGRRFEDCFQHVVQEKALYSDFGFMQNEFYLPNPNDVIYCGTSLTMDLLDTMYNSFCTGAFSKLTNTNVDNPVYDHVGPGILLYKWASMKNIMPIHNTLEYIVYRKQAEGLDCITDWEQLENFSRRIF